MGSRAKDAAGSFEPIEQLSTAVVDGRPARAPQRSTGRAADRYGALWGGLNEAFDYVPYLSMLARSGGNLTRTFILFRELQSAVNPYSTCKPESIDYLAPYPRLDAARTDPTALDGQPRFDLDRWDARFFERLHDFVGRAAALDVTVEVTLFSNTYADQIWELNPLHHANNVNGLSPIHWTEHITARQRDRLDRQLALVEKVVTECRDHPNVIFEPCNEPGAGAPVDPPVALVEQDEVNGWLDTIINAIRAADGGRHLIAGQEAFRYDPWDQPLDLRCPISASHRQRASAARHDARWSHVPSSVGSCRATSSCRRCTPSATRRLTRPSRSTSTRTTPPVSTPITSAGRSTASGPGSR